MSDDLPPIAHGTPHGYSGRGCRCDYCHEAIALYRRAARDHQQMSWWPTRRSTYLCACGFRAEVSDSWTFERVTHICQ